MLLCCGSLSHFQERPYPKYSDIIFMMILLFRIDSICIQTNRTRTSQSFHILLGLAVCHNRFRHAGYQQRHFRNAASIPKLRFRHIDPIPPDGIKAPCFLFLILSFFSPCSLRLCRIRCTRMAIPTEQFYKYPPVLHQIQNCAHILRHSG